MTICACQFGSAKSVALQPDRFAGESVGRFGFLVVLRCDDDRFGVVASTGCLALDTAAVEVGNFARRAALVVSDLTAPCEIIGDAHNSFSHIDRGTICTPKCTPV